MKITVTRETLLPALQAVSNVVERRQSTPILANVLLTVSDNSLNLVATDMEVEVAINCTVQSAREGATTFPAKKLFDICRSLPVDAVLQLEVSGDKGRVQSGRSRFTLGTLPAGEYPAVGNFPANSEFSVPAAVLLELISATQFAMAQQDVRYYLNGLLVEINSTGLRAVATDGHRLALSERSLEIALASPSQLIVPRKGVQEIQRMLGHVEGDVVVAVSDNHVKISTVGQAITTKLIDGKFPDYQRVMPKKGERSVTADREALKAAFGRTSILSNEKFRGVRLFLSNGLLRAATNNPEQEEAEEDVAVDYSGDELEIGFNVSYLLDVMGVLRSKFVKIELSDANSSAVIFDPEDERSRYVIMPMRL
ncbi:MAG: DNA polymerase III subunit beta [Gammaproteobacteria bacterium]|nr:DNA polymerase III subunit beta [Gammaproteobacteria bacterium]